MSIASPSLPVLQSTFSSSRLCWFTTVTCTRDISSHTAVALPRATAPQPTALSGFGCPTTLSAKPACTRSCPPMRTCSSTRGCEDWASLCDRKSSWNFRAKILQTRTPPLCPDCQTRSTVTNRWTGTWLQWDQSYRREHFESRFNVLKSHRLLIINPKDNVLASFLVKNLWLSPSSVRSSTISVVILQLP